jgi:selenide,water dikinase
VLKQLGMKPVPGLAITLISRDIETPYSGSLPGTLSGFLTHDDMNIDLRPLAQFAKARLIRATVEDIDLDAKIIRLADRPEIHFDILSLNIGSQPDASTILGADEFACPVKPIDKFLTRWESVLAEAVQRVSSQKDYAITMVGGGPASVELALAMQYRIHTECTLALESESSLKLSIISSSSEILARHNTKVRRAALDTLRRRNIKVELGQRVTRFLADSVQTDLGGEYACDAARALRHRNERRRVHRYATDSAVSKP